MWKVNPQFFGRGPLMVAVVGVGGTGSEIVSNLTHLHLALKALGYDGLHVVAFDPDRVSEANVVRQRYASADVGLFKSEVLIHRVNLTYAVRWQAVTTRFTATHARTAWDLVISCVDTRAARAELHKFAFSERFGFGQWKFWLDCGNDATIGQVVIGTPRAPGNRLRNHLPCATELHPELMDVSADRADDGPSCSALEALKKQDLLVNKMTAVLATDMLWRLLRDRELDCHARYFDLATNSLAGRAVPATVSARADDVETARPASPTRGDRTTRRTSRRTERLR